MKKALLLVLGTLTVTNAVAREGAVVQAVDRNGNPVGQPISLPDCRSCTVTQTGPNSYTIKVPDRVKQQVGIQPKKK